MASLHALLYDDTQNTALRQVLTAQLAVKELAVLVQVCTAFRSWLVDTGAQLFLGVTGDNAAGEHRVLRPWQPHLLLNGQPAMCKKKAVFVTPCVYSCYGRTADGRQMVSAVRPGASIDTERSGLTLRLVRASTRDEAEVLGMQNVPLFAKKKPRKGKGGAFYDTYPMGVHIEQTLSRHESPPGMYRLEVAVHLVHRDTHKATDAYTYTSDAFYVVAAPPRTAAAARARREQPHKRSRLV